MALDPNIALNANAPQPTNMFAGAELGMKIRNAQQQNLLMQQQIEASKANQALTEAQTPGAAAQSQSAQSNAAIDARKAAGVAAVQQAVKNNTVVNSDGTITTDPHGTAMQLMKGGFADEGFNYLQSSAKTSGDMADSDQKRIDVGNKFATTTAQMVSALPKSQQAGALAHIGQTIAADPSLQSTLGASPLMAVLTSDPTKLDAIKAGSMTPKEATELQINQQNANTASMNAGTSAESVAQSGAAGVSNAAARSPASPESQQAQADYLAANPNADPTRVKQLSAADIQHLGGTSASVTSNVVPAGTRGTAIADVTANTQQAQVLQQISDLSKKVAPLVGTSSGLLTKVNQLIEAGRGNPDLYALKQAIEQAKAGGSTINFDQPNPAITLGAANMAKISQQKAATSGQIATSGTFSAATPAVQGQAAPAPSQAAAPGTVVMTDAKGQTYHIPSAQVPSAMRDGLRMGAQ